MKKLLLILALFLSLTSFQSCKAQSNFFWSYPQTSTSLGYGALYNWYAVTDARNIAPVGFHVPTRDECLTLLSTLGGTGQENSNKLREIGLTYWLTPNTGATNEVGFNSRGAGERDVSGFGYIKYYHRILTSTEYNATYCRVFSINETDASSVSGYIWKKVDGASLRFIADSGTPTTATGNDGKVYTCVTIGTQTWTAANSNETKYRDGSAIPEVTDNATWAGLTTGAYCWYNNDINNK